jgi:hypothetical protein
MMNRDMLHEFNFRIISLDKGFRLHSSRAENIRHGGRRGGVITIRLLWTLLLLLLLLLAASTRLLLAPPVQNIHVYQRRYPPVQY